MSKIFQHTLIVGVLLTLGLSACITEDPTSLEPSDVYVKYFGSTATEEVVGLVQTSSNEFLLLGSTTNTVNGDEDYYLVKTDSAGNGIWQHTYGYEVGADHEDIALIQEEGINDHPSSIYLFNNDQNAMIIGTTDIADKKSIFMLNIDVNTGAAVDTLLYRYFEYREESIENTDRNLIGEKDTYGVDVIYNEANDEFIILGNVDSWSSSPFLSDPQSVFLMSIPANSMTIVPTNSDTTNSIATWYDLKGLQEEDTGVKLLEDDGNFYFMSNVTIGDNSDVGFGSDDIWIANFNPLSGVEINSGYYGSNNSDISSDFIVSGVFLMITGTSGTGQNEKAFFLSIPKSLPKTDSDGFTIDVTDQEGLNLDANGSQGKGLIRLDNGNVVIVGQVNDYTDEEREFKQDDVMLMRVDALGNLDTENFRVMGGSDNDTGNSIILREDGALIIGATVHFGGSATMFSLIKTNQEGMFEEI